MNVSKHKSYKNLNSVLFPLHTFFAILTAHLPARVGATAYFYRYLTHISTLATEYEWAAVLEYHTLYFNRRRNKMLEGSYEGWAEPEIGLLSSHVYPHRKPISVSAKATSKKPPSSTDPCRNYNLGKCGVSMCMGPAPHLLFAWLWQGAPTHTTQIGIWHDVNGTSVARRSHPADDPTPDSPLPPLPHGNLFPPRHPPPARPNTDPPRKHSTTGQS
ncbi:Integrase/recombinase xerD [Mycena indigotica]|uniref:Integrase/recombinase xerD n=1 Tax=Mycena indigotica TaxID=2126181 RepID=A0A8H6T7Z0_9AGAR|nr:Integrase/recombinase xerD [Mycena indigotica]KAF7312591.1 Integrase/recombinase xerD [Mycena indigotica]